MQSLERRRRLSGKKYTQIATDTGISYNRIWRFFTQGGPLRLNEIEQLSALLPEDATNGNGAAIGTNPDLSEVAS